MKRKSRRRKNPRLSYNQRLTARVGHYSFKLADAAYDMVDLDPSAQYVVVEAFGGDIPLGRLGAEVFWDAVLTWQKYSMGAAIFAWHRPSRRRGLDYWAFSIMRRHVAKKNGIPYITSKAARLARDNARAGKTPRSVKVLET
jgi:hypothetical protein